MIFLDKNHRLYSCAYWKNDTKNLEEAQQNKIDHIVKKLDIKEGQKILEVGCGWGGVCCWWWEPFLRWWWLRLVLAKVFL